MIDPNEIIETVEDIYYLVSGSIVDRRRTKTYAEARHVAIYLIRKLTGLSFNEMADLLHRDFTTIRASYFKTKKRFILPVKTENFSLVHHIVVAEARLLAPDTPQTPQEGYVVFENKLNKKGI